jgi:hypothetical protein
MRTYAPREQSLCPSSPTVALGDLVFVRGCGFSRVARFALALLRVIECANTHALLAPRSVARRDVSLPIRGALA